MGRLREQPVVISPVSEDEEFLALRRKVKTLEDRFAPGWISYVGVGRGWYQLIVDCDAELAAIDPGYQILQIKEKFGGLRYYIQPSGSDQAIADQLNEITTRYEKLAQETCEDTGRPGVLMRSIGGWYRTLNPEYAAGVLQYFIYKPVDQAKE